MSWVTPFQSGEARASQSSGIGLAGADTHGAIDAVDEDLSVADLTGLGGPYDGVDDFADQIGRYGGLDLDLGQEADGVFGAAIDFGVALLTAVSLDLGNGHPEHSNRGQSVAHFVNFERLDDSHDNLHGVDPPAKSQFLGWQVRAPRSCRATIHPRRQRHDNQ